ncbi:hypothetical protein LWF01_13120 [Saxibacter everestensis]|uniref:Uncharacterized protein n=1 Tax=Saxibacter everestensis TaxID=2909229 RepID=A0ABY8QQ21_9MICO|nr:hypothetical protein LWF01_13120 [Brevibacteriaceae bacterium ZFBP1038]
MPIDFESELYTPIFRIRLVADVVDALLGIEDDEVRDAVAAWVDAVWREYDKAAELTEELLDYLEDNFEYTSQKLTRAQHRILLGLRDVFLIDVDENEDDSERFLQIVKSLETDIEVFHQSLEKAAK